MKIGINACQALEWSFLLRSSPCYSVNLGIWKKVAATGKSQESKPKEEAGALELDSSLGWGNVWEKTFTPGPRPAMSYIIFVVLWPTPGPTDQCPRSCWDTDGPRAWVGEGANIGRGTWPLPAQKGAHFQVWLGSALCLVTGSGYLTHAS